MARTSCAVQQQVHALVACYIKIGLLGNDVKVGPMEGLLLGFNVHRVPVDVVSCA